VPEQPQIPVVLLHGILGSHRYLSGVQRKLNEAGFEVISVDLLGFGRSPWHADSFATEAHVDAIRARLGEAGFKQYIVLGHSLGALLGLELLESDPRCLGCVCASTPAFGCRAAFNSNTLRMSPTTWLLIRSPLCVTRVLCRSICQQRWFWRPLAVMIGKQLWRLFVGKVFAKEIVEDFFDHSHDSCAFTFEQCLVPLMLRPLRASALAGRALFLHGTRDESTPAKELARKVGTEGSRYVELIDGADHFSILRCTDALVAACTRLRSRVYPRPLRTDGVS